MTIMIQGKPPEILKHEYRLNRLEPVINVTHSDRDQLNAKLEAEEARYAEMSKQLEELDVDGDEKPEEYLDLKKQVDKLYRTNNELVQERERLDTRIDELEKEKEDTEADLKQANEQYGDRIYTIVFEEKNFDLKGTFSSGMIGYALENPNMRFVLKRADRNTGRAANYMMINGIACYQAIVEAGIKRGVAEVWAAGYLDEVEDLGIITTYIPDKDMDKFIALHGPQKPSQALKHYIDLLGTLKKIHSLDLVHSDGTPSNLKVGARSTLMDHGIARRVGREAKEFFHGKMLIPEMLVADAVSKYATSEGIPYDKFRSMPEVKSAEGRKSKEAKESDDIFYISNAIYEFMFGFYVDKTTEDLKQEEQKSDRPDSIELVDTPLPLPTAFHEVLSRGLATLEEDRFTNANGSLQELFNYLQDDKIEPVSPDLPIEERVNAEIDELLAAVDRNEEIQLYDNLFTSWMKLQESILKEDKVLTPEEFHEEKGERVIPTGLYDQFMEAAAAIQDYSERKSKQEENKPATAADKGKTQPEAQP